MEIQYATVCFSSLNIKHTVSYKEEKSDYPITTTIDRSVKRQTGNCARRNAKSYELGLVRILCGSLEHLHNAFAELDEQALGDATPLVRSNRDTELQNRVRTLLKNLDKANVLDEFSPNFTQIRTSTPVV